jgi:hypothetical protein
MFGNKVMPKALRTGSFVLAMLAVAAPDLAAPGADAAELYLGGAMTSITPDGPVPLAGQMRTRISQAVESPVTATVLALESRQGDRVLDQAILVACDLVGIREGVLDEVRAALKERVPDVDPQKVVLSATHTHTAPVMEDGLYDVPASGIVQPGEYRKFFVQKVVEAIEEAWRSRQPGSVGWGLGHAVVAQNRLAVYADGRAQMYGPTTIPKFERFEGYEDHGVEVLFFWNAEGELMATGVNLACPAQEVEGRSAVNADFWHQIRETLRAKYGKDLLVLAWTGAAGDQSPHLMYRKDAEERMRRLRKLDRLQEISRRVVAAWEEAYEGARQEKHSDAVLLHRVETIELPVRLVTQEEALAAENQVETLKNDPGGQRIRQWQQSVIDRFNRQKPDDAFPTEIHVIRLGDVAIATNQFELFTDYGVQMKARSPALQTFVVQLAGPGTYLPTPRGVAGGAYGAVIQSNRVGPEGGRALVAQTLELIGSMWPKQE